MRLFAFLIAIAILSAISCLYKLFQKQMNKYNKSVEDFSQRPNCSGSGCTFYDKWGYFRDFSDFYEQNKYNLPYYYLQYPSYPLYFNRYPNNYFNNTNNVILYDSISLDRQRF